jgi:hypothetical protein
MMLPPAVVVAMSLQAATPVAGKAAGSNLTGAMINAIAVSPIYDRTGLVVAQGLAANCSKNCQRLWVSHDGGAGWQEAAASGYQWGIPLSLVVNPQGKEVVLAAASGSGGVQFSEDGGQTWQSTGVAGRAAPAPSYGHDGTVAVAGGQSDTLLTAQGRQTIAGSSGAYSDQQFAYMAGYPSTGTYSPALLGAIDTRASNSVVLRCDASLKCASAFTLPGTTLYSGPADLLPAGDYANTGAVFARTATAVFKSSNGGATFTPLSPIPTSVGAVNGYSAMALAPGYRESGPVRTVFVAAIQIPASSSGLNHSVGGVYRSDDGGKTWSSVDGGSDLRDGALSLAIAPDGRIFAGASGGGDAQTGLLCSDDAKTWQPTCSPRGPLAAGGAAKGASRTAAAAPPAVAGASGNNSSGVGSATATDNGASAAGQSEAGSARNVEALSSTRGSSRSPGLIIAGAILGVVLLLGVARVAVRRTRGRQVASQDRL